MDSDLASNATLETAKEVCGIHKPNGEMTDEDIATICKWIGSQAPDTIQDGQGPILQQQGLAMMLTITLLEFPEFYERHKLSQFN